MIRTHYVTCKLPRPQADALNAESGRIYTAVLVEHYRIYRHTGHWLSKYGAQKLNDRYDAASSKLLHSHSSDAAQQGFYEAIKLAWAQRRMGLAIRFPYKRKRFRTTVWKNTAIYKKGDKLQLSLARERDPLVIRLPAALRDLAQEAFREARLVYDVQRQRYQWHLVVEDGSTPPDEPPGANVAAVDLGEVHPAAVTDGEAAAVITCRELRAIKQYTHKRLAVINAKQSQHQRGSRRWRRLQARKARFLARQAQRIRDLEHKISHEVVEWAVEQQVGILAIGDVRNVGSGKRLNRKSQQKVSNWSHGRLREYITYKAEAQGIHINDKVNEAHTSQTCPQCRHRHKPRGRIYRCPNPDCGAIFHRDIVGAANILSRYRQGELARVRPPEPKYRYPFNVRGKRSPSDTGQVARLAREAAGL